MMIYSHLLYFLFILVAGKLGFFSTLQLQIDKQQPVGIENSPSQHLLKQFLNYTLEVRGKVFVPYFSVFTAPCEANLILLALSFI